MTAGIGWPDIVDAWNGIAPVVKPMYCEELDGDALPSTAGRVLLAREHKQHSGSFRARSAVWFLRARRAAGELPAAGIAVAAGTESAAAAWAWAAHRENVAATVFVPPSLDTVRMLPDGPVTVQVVPDGDAVAHRDAYAREVGALTPNPADPLLAAGAGTWVLGVNCVVWGLATVMIPVVDGTDDGLLLGTVTAAHHYGIKTVLVAASGTAIPTAAQQVLAGDAAELAGMASDGHRISMELVTVSVGDAAAAEQMLRRRGRIVNAEGALPWAALVAPNEQPRCYYRPAPGESVAALLAGPPADSARPDRVNPLRLQPRPARSTDAGL
ncbi:pyridoxal-phosphate dependent enzyme [Nocardia sp. BMG51109]|uniref:pyridoxal-phosphate dependent enzyme n=1 Tax=Nocardia sp. BMG51109 TaxID=1056816 RepID=UPI00046725D7|nr:pyridoxal-phosphate dependent enzyme [Nocardia sp. BMG51109]